MPAKVTGVMATVSLYAEATIAWKAVTGATSYQVQFKEHGKLTWSIGPLVKVTHANVTGLKPAITYDFQVIANGV